jgi:hypothetical protein
MKLHLIVPAITAVLGLSLACAPVHAQTDAPATSTSSDATAAAPEATKFKGTITAIDTTAKTVTVKSKGGDLTLNITDDTKGGKALSKLAVGDKVGGAYTTDASGKMTATALKKAKAKKPAADAGGDAGGGGGE